MDPPQQRVPRVTPSMDSSQSSSWKPEQFRASAYSAVTTSHDFDQWKVSVTKGPILSSQCACNVGGGVPNAGQFLDVGAGPVENSGDFSSQQTCAFCRYDPLLKLKYLPDMVFAQNRIVISSPDRSSGIEFNAVDAVNSIRDQPLGDIQVASAETWQGSRSEALKTFGSKAVKYDWTYTPDYKGTTFGEAVTVEPTTETLDMSLLSRRDPVSFFEELQLYGDELDDNGCAEMDLKIRVVESYLFILMRFYLRVDHVAVELHDVRLMFKKGENFMLRESSVREAKISELPGMISPMDPVQLWSGLVPGKTMVEKISFSH